MTNETETGAPTAEAIAAELHRDGLSLRAIGEQLSARGLAPPRGGVWRPGQVQRLISRAAADAADSDDDDAADSQAADDSALLADTGSSADSERLSLGTRVLNAIGLGTEQRTANADTTPDVIPWSVAAEPGQPTVRFLNAGQGSPVGVKMILSFTAHPDANPTGRVAQAVHEADTGRIDDAIHIAMQGNEAIKRVLALQPKIDAMHHKRRELEDRLPILDAERETAVKELPGPELADKLADLDASKEETKAQIDRLARGAALFQRDVDAAWQAALNEIAGIGETARAAAISANQTDLQALLKELGPAFSEKLTRLFALWQAKERLWNAQPAKDRAAALLKSAYPYANL